MTAPRIDLSFPHHWQAEILAARPLILPPRHFTYPTSVEEVERGALELLIHPHRSGAPGLASETRESTDPTQPHLSPAQTLRAPSIAQPHRAMGRKATNSTPPHPDPAQIQGAPGLDSQTWETTNPARTLRAPSIAQPHRAMGGKATTPSSDAQSFLATCALGFRDSSLLTGVWSTPHPEEICAVAGGYAYLIDTRAPERFTLLHYRPVFAVIPAVAQGLLLFAGNRTILAWSAKGPAWESPKLSDEGITITSIEGDTVHGLGWNLLTDKEAPFALNLRSGDLQSAGSR